MSETTETPRLDSIVSNAEWFPWWQKPILWPEWKQLEHQALRSCQMTGETYRDAKRTDMPDWWIEKVARSWYRARRRYWRIKCGNDARLDERLKALLAEIDCG